MPTGRALAIGLNSVDPGHYAGWSGNLNACEADALSMAAIAGNRGFDEVNTLITRSATREQVQNEIRAAAEDLQSGDLFMLSYSGHGGQLPDMNDDEPDAMDETWCLYDGEMIDDEVYGLLANFVENVRVLVLSDSCHSGSVVKEAYFAGTMSTRGQTPSSPTPTYRAMSPDAALQTYRLNSDFYQQIQSSTLRSERDSVAASVLLISGCQDNQLSADGIFNGLFTGQMLQVWKQGLFDGPYEKFHREIVRRMPPDQTPNYFRAGQIALDFEAQQPFTV